MLSYQWKSCMRMTSLLEAFKEVCLVFEEYLVSTKRRSPFKLERSRVLLDEPEMGNGSVYKTFGIALSTRYYYKDHRDMVILVRMSFNEGRLLLVVEIHPIERKRGGWDPDRVSAPQIMNIREKADDPKDGAGRAVASLAGMLSMFDRDGQVFKEYGYQRVGLCSHVRRYEESNGRVASFMRMTTRTPSTDMSITCQYSECMPSLMK